VGSNFVHPVEDKVILEDHHPESVPPVPCIVFDYSVSVDLDPEVESDERPAECPAEDVGENGMVGGKVEV
jgi:hypothetical protein